MSDLDFHARLARIENGEAGFASQFLSDGPARTRRERVERAIRVLEAAGLPRSHTYPPFYDILAVLRLAPRPYHYQSIPTLFVVYFTAMVLIFGSVYATGIPGLFESGPLAYLHRGGWPLICGIGTIAGIFGAIRVRQQIQGKRLPRWSDL